MKDNDRDGRGTKTEGVVHGRQVRRACARSSTRTRYPRCGSRNRVQWGCAERKTRQLLESERACSRARSCCGTCASKVRRDGSRKISGSCPRARSSCSSAC